VSALLLLVVLAVGWRFRRPRRPVDRYEALGPLPKTWRPSSRTIVRTDHLSR
jgi:hypothetical protein